MSLISYYFTKQLFYEEKYGKNTVIIIQRGPSYWCYEYDPSNCANDADKTSKDKIVWEYRIGHAVTLSSILVLRLTRMNTKKKYTIDNPDMIGFPMIVYDKILKTLLANDYVVIRIDQEITTDKDENDNVPRFVAEIVSPTMNFNRIALTEASANIVCIYIEYIKSKNIYHCDGYLVTSGVASLDIITGNTNITEFYSKANDEAYCAQEIYRFLISHCPKEIVIHIDDMPDECEDLYSKYLDKILELRRYDRSKIFINKVNPEFKKPSYQIAFLNKLYNKNKLGNKLSTSILSNYNICNNKIIEELDLDKVHYGRLAFLLLIQYCHEYNGAVSNLKPPHISWFDDKNVLVLTHNAALCLEVIPNFRYQNKKKEEINSLLSIIDKTSTHLGKRCLEYLLLNPMVDSKQIESYYNMVDELSIKYDEFLWLSIEKKLKGLADISRLQRKIELGLMLPKDFTILIRSYEQIISLYTFIQSKNLPHLREHLNFDIEKLKDFVNHYMDLFHLNYLECCLIDVQKNNENEDNKLIKVMIFVENPMKDEAIVKEYNMLIHVNRELGRIEHYLNSLIKGKVKLTTKNIGKNGKPIKGAGKDGQITFFSTSQANATKILTSKYNDAICGKLTSTAYGAASKIISSTLIEELCFKKDEMKRTLGILMLKVFENAMEEVKNHIHLFTPLCNLVGKLDILHSYAQISYKNKYFRPTILHEGTSFLKIVDIRHPIAEKLIDGQYIVNDVNLGKINSYNGSSIKDDSPYGIILYGINMCGKSTYLKAVAQNVIMSQIGCFVPSIMIFRPYTKMITRLCSQDNIFKSESSFQNEILELRTVLKQSNENTLVIIDELCTSTETQSAICITVGAIIILLKLKASFLMASHLHEIINIPMIIDIDKKLLSINHLSVINDDINDTLIYDRKLKPGSGSSIYGISVAKFLRLPADLIDIANKVALYIENENEEFLSTKKSRYHPDVYMDACEKCGGHATLISHHIQEQNKADSRGFIGYMNKNVKENIQVLCDSCHKKHHKHLTLTN